MIHGVGEQVPMKTLRDFVRAVWTDDDALRRPGVRAEPWSAPDRVSRNYELRRLITARAKNGVRTDFFEYYWAHLVKDTKLAHVFAWVWSLLKTPPPKTTPSVFIAWIMAVVIAALGLGGAIAVLLGWDGGCAMAILHTQNQALAALAPFTVALFANLVLLPVVGDAARYLVPVPYNIQSRHEIRSAGVELLSSLIDSGKYERIIVVGHSLGSVIGYDVLRAAWPRYNIRRPTRLPASTDELEKLESLAAAADFDIDAYRRRQKSYAKEFQENGNPWRVTDFITLGSPLASAAWLLADGAGDFDRRIEAREYPSCPPYVGGNQDPHAFSYVVPEDKEEARPAFRTPDHAAVFGPVRWTNLYFPSVFGAWGDVVGGPVSRLFGKGVVDIPVSTLQRLGFFTHNFYWRPERGLFAKNAHIKALRKALNLLDV